MYLLERAAFVRGGNDFCARPIVRLGVFVFTGSDGKGTVERKLFRETPGGYLYPAPLPTDAKQREAVIDYFRLLGRLVGKALIDSRLVDLPYYSKVGICFQSAGFIPLAALQSFDSVRATGARRLRGLPAVRPVSLPLVLLAPGCIPSSGDW